MKITVCDACALEGKLNPQVKYRYGLRSMKGSPVHLCERHKGLKFTSAQEQLAMMEQAERQVKLVAV